MGNRVHTGPGRLRGGEADGAQVAGEAVPFHPFYTPHYLFLAFLADVKENFSVIYLKQLKARRNSAAVEMNLTGGGGALDHTVI